MLGAAYGSVGDIEIMWTLLAASGIILAILGIREARQDGKALRALGIKNGRRLLTRASIWSEYCRLAIQAIFFSIGVYAMWLPQPQNLDLPIKYRAFNALFTWGIITAEVLLLFKTSLGFYVRRKLNVKGTRG